MSIASWVLALNSLSVISWATAQCRTGLVTPCKEELGLCQNIKRLEPTHLISTSLFFAVLQMLSYGTSAPLHDGTSLCLATYKAQQMSSYFSWRDRPERRKCVWLERCQSKPLCGGWDQHMWLFCSCLINRACFGNKRLKAEKDRGGVSTVTYCRLLP